MAGEQAVGFNISASLSLPPCTQLCHCRKKMDPLEVYVPAVIFTQLQIKYLEKSLEVDDKPEYAACRSLLRSCPAACKYPSCRTVCFGCWEW